MEQEQMPNTPILRRGDDIDALRRLGWMLGAAVAIVFVMILVSFWAGHYLGRQTVAQEIRVEPLIKTQNQFTIDASLAIQESQKQPIQFKVSSDGQSRAPTITQDQAEQIVRSLSSVRAEVSQIKDGIRVPPVVMAQSIAEGSEKPKPVIVRTEVDVRAIPEVVVIPAEAKAGEPKKTEIPAKAEAPSSPTERMKTLMDKAEGVVSHQEASSPGMRQAWENKWKSRLQDGKDENNMANEALLDRLMGVKGRTDAGKPVDGATTFDMAMILLRYRLPGMQLPSPVLDLLKKDDKTFSEALNFISQVAKAP